MQRNNMSKNACIAFLATSINKIWDFLNINAHFSLEAVTEQ